jgi:hypothetical protein
MTIQTRYILASLLGLSLGTVFDLHSQTLASVSGRVYDADTNAPLRGVGISSVSPPVNGGAPVVAFARSNDDGTYTLKLTPGKHVLCVDAGRVYLDPCQWSSGSTAINSAEGAHLDLPLKHGVLLIVHVSDPGGFAKGVQAADPLLAKIPEAPLVSAMVTDQSGTARLIPVIQCAHGTAELALAVPPGQPFAIALTSSLLNLADASGKPLPQNAFGASFTSPEADPSYVPVSFLWHRTGPNVPSKVFSFGVIGAAVR